MEDKKEEVKKTNNGLGPGFMVILVVLFLIGIGLGFAAAKVIDLDVKEETKEVEKDKKKEEKKEPVVTNYAVTDEKVSKLIDNLDVGILDDSCKTLEIYVNNKKVEAKDITIQKAYRIAESAEFFNSGKQSVSLDEFTKVVQKYLGKDYNFNPSDGMGKGQCMSYVYDASTKTFNKQETACGGTCGPMPSYKMIKAVDTDGVLKIDVKVIFASLDEGKDGYYSDYAKTNKIGTFEDDREALYDKGSNYQFTFKLEDGNYVFVSSEPVK